MSGSELTLLLANAVYATSYVVTRVVLDEVPPAILAQLRLVLGALVLVLACRGRLALDGASRGDRLRIALMGIFGFAGAFGFFHWGLTRSTATNAALLIIVEPVAVMLLSPALLGEGLNRRELGGAALALVGAVVVVVNGVPGVTERLVPHWRGDVLLVISGVAYASYSLLGRSVLLRHDALRVTTQSILWGTVAMIPFAAAEWRAGGAPGLTLVSGLGTAYLALVITALGYLVWNYALARVKAPRAAIFLTVQPIMGALLGVLLLGERLTAFTLLGAALILAGLLTTMSRGRA